MTKLQDKPCILSFQFNNRKLAYFENDLMIGQGTEAEVLIEGEEIVEVTENLKHPVTDN